MPSVSTRRSGYLLVIAGSMLFACTGVMSKAAFDGGIEPLQLAAFRSYGAALLLLPFLILSVRHLSRRDLVPVALFAVVGIVLAQAFYYEAISRMDIAVTLVIVYTGPLLVAAYQRLFHAERLPLLAYIAMCLAVAGVAVAVIGGAGGIGAISLIGVAFALLTALSFAGQAILGARQPLTLPPLARTGAGMTVAALIWLPLVPIWQLPFDSLGDPTQLDGRLELSIAVWIPVVFAIVLGSVVPYACIISGFSRLGAGAGSMAGMTEPIVAPLLAWFVLGQILSPLQALGIAVTIACVAVVERQRFKHTAANEILVAEL